MRSANQSSREGLKSPELDSQFQELVANSPLEEKDRSSVLSWIRAVRDECSGALRKSQDYSALITRMGEYQLRSSLFQLLAQREPDRAQKQRLQGDLLIALQSAIQSVILEDNDSSEILEAYRSSLANLIPGLASMEKHELNPDGPLLVVETDYRQDAYQLPGDTITGKEESAGQPDQAMPDAHDAHSMTTVVAETAEGTPSGEASSSDQQELHSLRAENEELKKKLNDFLEEWGEGIRIDGRTVSILTQRKIIVKKSSQGNSE